MILYSLICFEVYLLRRDFYFNCYELLNCASHGVAKSQTWLSDFTFTFHFHALEKETATHSSVLAWRIPGTGEPGGLPSMGSRRVGHDWSDLAAAASVTLQKEPSPLQRSTEIGWELEPLLQCCSASYKIQRNYKILKITVHVQLGQILDNKIQKDQKAQLPLLKIWVQKQGVMSKSRVLPMSPALNTTKGVGKPAQATPLARPLGTLHTHPT